jgi:hypothetical protein
MNASQTIAALALLTCLACGTVAEPAPTAVRGSGGSGSATLTPVAGTPGAPGGGAPGTPIAVDPAAQPAAEAAASDAAARLGVPRAQVAVVRIESREWPDGSLGCPQPGEMYIQVITPGYLIVVAGAGRQLEYHADTRGRAVFCRQI